VTNPAEWKPIVETRTGRLKLREDDDVREDLGIRKIQNWSKMAID
jgi:hypothetical protein